MLKQIFPLLFTLIFSINLFGQNNDIYKEISDIKLQIQEIKLLDARDDREKKIEKLEKDIKELEEKFNQNNIDKKEIDGKIETQDKLINIISISIGLFGVLITGIVIFFAFKFEKIAKGEAKEESKKEVENWIKENKNIILEPIINEGNNLLKNIRKEADLLLQDYQSTMKKHNLKDELDSKEKDILEKVNILLESKEIENYTFNDWHSKFLDYFYKDKFDDALKAIDNAIKITKNEIEIVSSLYNKGVILERMDGKAEEAIKVYDELIKKFKDSKENNILERVANAFYNKGVAFGKMDGKVEEAIKVYDEVINRFKDSKENNILEAVANALLNKIEMNLISEKTNSKEDLDLFLNLVKENKEKLLQFEMLQIFEKAKDTNQDEKIKNWQIEFKDVELGDWSFKELKTWAETLEDEVKKRVLRYIDIFEKHKSLE
ncbi:tetratricopeptide repeat protein [Aliarcobacter butzleri]|uniref:tetratricopeptide repeat protein n=1 Tax=Aliarcobacter butzleri TaxID=28197 RepID=UPI0021B3B935|nr:tetratricopeptide repeat protein [Aliarcobacter butzleri]UWY59570.1 tetratricopeptide repeat protein [Aliarcobacter butzleri]